MIYIVAKTYKTYVKISNHSSFSSFVIVTLELENKTIFVTLGVINFPGIKLFFLVISLIQ